MAVSAKAQTKTHLYTWEGTDKKGSRITGESQATNVAMVRADLRRQGINPLKVRKKAISLFSSRKRRLLLATSPYSADNWQP